MPTYGAATKRVESCQVASRSKCRRRWACRRGLLHAYERESARLATRQAKSEALRRGVVERELQALQAARSAASSPAIGRGRHIEVHPQLSVKAVGRARSVDGKSLQSQINAGGGNARFLLSPSTECLTPFISPPIAATCWWQAPTNTEKRRLLREPFPRSWSGWAANLYRAFAHTGWTPSYSAQTKVATDLTYRGRQATRYSSKASHALCGACTQCGFLFIRELCQRLPSAAAPHRQGRLNGADITRKGRSGAPIALVSPASLHDRVWTSLKRHGEHSTSS